MKSEKSDVFWRTAKTVLVMTLVSVLLWVGIRSLQTDVRPVAKPLPKVEQVP